MLRNFFNTITDIPSTDPEDSRRRKLLTILLIGVAVLPLPLIPLAIVLGGTPEFTAQDAATTIWIAIAVILVSILLYLINRFWSGPAASVLFLLFLCGIFIFADSPEELANGRSLLLFAIPVVFSGILLGPRSTFVFATLSSVEIAVIAYLHSIPPNTPAMVTLYALAIVSWLSSRSLEQALKDLRQINADLDRRVEDRTRELSAALARELEEAGRSQAILEGIADGVAVFDPSGNSIVANPALSDMLGIPISDLRGITMDALLQKVTIVPQEREAVLNMLANPQPNLPSVRLRMTERTVLVNASQVLTGLGDVIGTVAVFRDFTREAEVEQMKNAFVGMVSHELRTPLNAIIGYAEMMREAVYGPIAPHQANIMERIENSGKRLLSLVSDLLDQAQIEAGRMKIRNETFLVSNLIDGLHVLEKQVREKNLQLVKHLDSGMPAEVVGDVRRLQQILLNLVGNSIKFMDRGEIRVNIHPVDKDHWGLEVSDTGPGIPADAQEYIFESFRQVEGVTTREHGGIGLGLAIVKSLVGLMGGQIYLKSEIGQGTAFSILLPYVPPKETK